MAIDTVVLAALPPVSLSPWRQSHVQQKAESLSSPDDISSPYVLADRTGNHQALLAEL